MDRLAEALSSGSPADPIAPVEVVVGSRGMERHLRHALAERLGVCANLVCPFPAAAIDSTFGLARAPGDPPDPWSPDAVAWRILEVAPALAAQGALGPLGAAVAAACDPAGVIDARSWASARALADLFDRYITYRPELAVAWSAGQPSGDGPHTVDAVWQAAIWQAVQEAIGAPHREARLRAGEARMSTGAASEAGSLPPLRFFGIASLPPRWIAALDRLARVRPVELYLLAPSSAWLAHLGRAVRGLPPEERSDPERVDTVIGLLSIRGDTVLADAGHPLLMAWGHVARDMQLLLEDVPAVDVVSHDRFVSPAEEALAAGVAPTALAWLHDDIVSGLHPAHRPDAVPAAARAVPSVDRSIQFHACHGPTRQVEVLRDAILDLLAADPTLEPRDIVVMTPDVEGFAPRVAAVFDRADVGASIPWELADRAARRVNPVADALLRVLELAEGRVRASEVLDLLGNSAIRTRFALDEDDVTTAHGWLVASGARWGIDAAHRVAHGQPDDPQNTWRFGLERLVVGLVDPSALSFGGVAPVGVVEGADAARVGRVVAAVTALASQIDALRAPRPLAAWRQALDAAVSALCGVDPRSAWLNRSVRDAVRGLDAGEAFADRAVGLDAVRAVLGARLDGASSAAVGRGGAVTVCGLVPERAIPYRVVCWLGMDEGTFPRGGRRPAHDLTARPRRVGDRDVRDEDRLLLLEAVLSARDALIVTWTGRDARTNEVRPPAVPVDVLRDALDATLPSRGEGGRASDRFLVEHPLQAFDPANFDPGAPIAAPGGRPRSFEGRLLAGAAAVRHGGDAPFRMLVGAPDAASAGDDLAALTVDGLEAFWRHPVRAWMRRRLGVHLPWEGDATVPDREPIDAGRRVERELFTEAWGLTHAGETLGPVWERARARGLLPLGNAGDLVTERLDAEIQALAEEAYTLTGGADPGSVDVDAAVGGVRLSGRVHGVYGPFLVDVGLGASEYPTDLLSAWIRLAALALARPEVPWRAIVLRASTGGNAEVKLLTLGLAPEPGELATHLGWLVTQWARGQVAPLPVYRGASHAFAKSWCKACDTAPGCGPAGEEADAWAEALSAAHAAWHGGHKSSGDAGDAWLTHAFGGDPPFGQGDASADAAFAAMSVGLWRPVLGARQTARQVARWGNDG